METNVNNVKSTKYKRFTMIRVNSGNGLFPKKVSYGFDICSKRWLSAGFGRKCHGRLVYSFCNFMSNGGLIENRLQETLCRVIEQSGIERHDSLTVSCPRRLNRPIPKSTKWKKFKKSGIPVTNSVAVRNELCCNLLSRGSSEWGALDICGKPSLNILFKNRPSLTSMIMKGYSGCSTRRVFCEQSLFGLGMGITRQSHVIGKGSNVPKRWYSTQLKSPTYYYDVLGITPKANLKEIKNAYYSLSKLYHPDLKTDNASQEKFAEISEAYEVLGNKRNKRIYDRGIMNPLDQRTGHSASNVDDDYEDILRGRHGQFRKRGPIQTGRSNIYNFDEFYKQHYGDSIRKAYEQKKRKERQTEVNNAIHIRRSWGFTAALFVVFLTIFSFKRLQ